MEVVDGQEKNRPDLSERITASGEGMNVSLAGMQNTYQTAKISVPADSTAEKALLPSHSSGEQNGAELLKALGLKAPIRAQMRLGEGSGAVMLLPLLDMALSLYRSGQSFDRLGIAAYTPQE